MSKILTKAKQIYTTAQQQTDTAKEKKEQGEKEQEQGLVKAFQEKLEAALSSTMKEELPIAYEWASYPRATFEYLELYWNISKHGDGWSLDASATSNYGHDIVYVHSLNIEREMLYHFGQQQIQIEKKAAERADMLAADALYRAELEKRTQAKQATMFAWPKNRKLTIYKMNVVLGIIHSDEDGTTTNLLSGWTTEDHLEQRYATFQPYIENEYDKEVQPARRKRFGEGIAPIWDELVAHSVEDLPVELRYKVYVELEGVGTREDEQGVDRLVASERRYPYRVSIGWQPLPWICDLLK